MTAGTAIVAVAPDYAHGGMLAPIILVGARLLQGFSAGGEFGSSTAFLAEQDLSRRGLYTSLQASSQGVTTLLAVAAMVALDAWLTPAQVLNWGWRLPFVFGLLVGPVGLYSVAACAKTGTALPRHGRRP